MAYSAAVLRSSKQHRQSLGLDPSKKPFNPETTLMMSQIYGDGLVFVDAGSENSSEANGVEFVEGVLRACVVDLGQIAAIHANGVKTGTNEKPGDISDSVKEILKSGETPVINQPFALNGHKGIGGATKLISVVPQTNPYHNKRFYLANGTIATTRHGVYDPTAGKWTESEWDGLGRVLFKAGAQLALDTMTTVAGAMGVSEIRLALAVDTVGTDDGVVATKVTYEPGRSPKDGIDYIVQEMQALRDLAIAA